MSVQIFGLGGRVRPAGQALVFGGACRGLLLEAGFFSCYIANKGEGSVGVSFCLSSLGLRSNERNRARASLVIGRGELTELALRDTVLNPTALVGVLDRGPVVFVFVFGGGGRCRCRGAGFCVGHAGILCRF